MSPSMVKEQIKFRSLRKMFTIIQVIVYCFQCKKKNPVLGDACMICMSKMHETFN